MKHFFMLLLVSASLYAIQIDQSDFKTAQKYLSEMSGELDKFKRTLVEYDMLIEDADASKSSAIKQTKKKLLINKRIYNSRVDDLAGLAFKSLYGEIKNVKSMELSQTLSCGEKGLAECKEMTLQALRRKAIEESSASFLESSTLVENSTLTSDKIKNDFKGVIKNFRILNEELLSGGIGYAITAFVEVEGNLPKEAIDYFKSEKILWKDEVNFDNFPSLPIVTVRIPSYRSKDKLTQWLGLKPRNSEGIFAVLRLAQEYHYTGADSTNHIFQPVGGFKLGYEFSTWRLYAKVLLALTNKRNTSYINTNYFYGSATGGVDIFINNFAVGAGAGIALQDYDLDGIGYNYKGIYTFFDASYRFDITRSFILDLGAEIAQVNWFYRNAIAPAEINTRGIYALYAEVGYKF